MGKMTILSVIVLLLLGGGCTTFGPYYDSYSPPQPSSAEIVLTKYNDAFFSFYNSDLRSWIGKNYAEVKSAFEVTPGEHGCCAPNIHSLDVDNNGYISYESADEIRPYRSGRLIFYIKRGKIYNIVKE